MLPIKLIQTNSLEDTSKKSVCSHMSNCPLYATFLLKPMLQFWQVNYCENERKYQQCARYELSSSGKPVPLNLLPNGKLLPISSEKKKK